MGSNGTSMTLGCQSEWKSWEGLKVEGWRLKQEHADREKDSNQIMKKIDRVIIKENAIKPNLVWLIDYVGTGKPP